MNYVNIMTKYDQLVRPYTSGIEEGMTNIVLQDHRNLDQTKHFEIAADRNATLHVLNALTRPTRGRSPARWFCRSSGAFSH